MGVGRTGGELHVRTQIVQTLLAARAEAARLARFDGYIITWEEVRHGRADGVDRPGRFVAHDEWLFCADGVAVHSAVGPEMDLFWGGTRGISIFQVGCLYIPGKGGHG